MRKNYWLAFILIVAAVAACASAYWWTGARKQNSSVLSFLPRDPAAVIYIDFAALRQTTFLAQVAAWAPQPQKDPEYAQFLQDTGFDFERDLDHLAIATQKSADASTLTFIAEGKFDRKKISAYALRNGKKQNVNDREIFSVPLDAGKTTLSFTFVSDRLVVLTDYSNGLADSLGAPAKWPGEGDWQQRFTRLAGSPVFAVVHQDAGALANKAPGGFRSPQLSSLLDQLQWLAIAGKPGGDQLQIVAEGECASETTSHQLADLLNGVVILAQTGLNDPKVRQQLNPEVRQAYLDLLKSADISKLDRGETKAVRLVFSVTPAFLDAARASLPLQPAPPTPSHRVPQKHAAAPSRKSGT